MVSCLGMAWAYIFWASVVGWGFGLVRWASASNLSAIFLAYSKAYSFFHSSDKYSGTKKSRFLPNIQFGRNLLFLFSVRYPQAAGITEVKSEHRMLSICYQNTYWGLRDGGFKSYLFHFHYSHSIDAKRGSVNSTSLLTSVYFYFQLREIVPKTGTRLEPGTKFHFGRDNGE